MAFDLTWANVNSVAIAPAALQVLIGGVITSCKLWIPTEERLRDSVELKREALRESVSKQLHSLLTIAEASISSELRGSPPQSPDHVGDFIKSFFLSKTHLFCWVFLSFGSLAMANRKFTTKKY